MRVAALVLFAVAGLSAMAEPCDCAPGWPRGVTDELSDADAVFIATLVSERIDVERSDQYGQVSVLTFDVEAGYKNVRTESIELAQRPDSTCNVDFKRGQTYLVYAFRKTNGDLHTHNCSRTTLADDADDDIAQLPEPEYIREELR